MKMNTTNGISLVELMIGILVSSLVLLTVYNSIIFQQAMQRTSVSGDSALSQALTSLYFIGNDTRLAGLGFMADGGFVCSGLNAYYNGVKSNGGIVAPVRITNGVNQPDQITFMYGSASFGAAPAKLLTTMTATTAPLYTNLAISNQGGNHALLAVPGTLLPCTLIEITQTRVLNDMVELSHDSQSSAYNPASPQTAFANAITYPDNSVLLNIGRFNWLTWRINGNNSLEVVDNMTGTIQQIADNIVQLRAEYGVTSGATNTVNQWVSATGEWQNLDAAHVARIRAIRIAVVARSAQRERSSNAQGVCNTTTQQPIPWPNGAALTISNLQNWQCYRYRTYKTVLPLKNVVLGVS